MSKREYDMYKLVGQCTGDYICKVTDSDGEWYIIPAYPWNSLSIGFMFPARTLLEGICMKDAVFCTESLVIESSIELGGWGFMGVTKEDAQLFYDYFMKDQEESLAKYSKDEQKKIYRSIEIITVDDAEKQASEYKSKGNKND